MKKNSADKVEMSSFDDLFGKDNSVDKVIRVPLDQLHTFKNHPFKVRNDEKMLELAESIKVNGVLVPGLVRPRADGGYEIVAGHCRKYGSRLANVTDMPVIVRNYTDDEATIIMVDSNIQREDILPSEKAFAYKMKLEALKHQGKASDYEGEAADEVGKKAGDSGRSVQRYIRLTYLIPELLELVDNKKLGFINGVTLSYLAKDEQQWVFEVYDEEGGDLSAPNISLLKSHSEKQELTLPMVKLILLEKQSKPVSVTIKSKRIKEFFSEEYNKEQIEEIIYSLLTNWKASQE